MRLMIIALLALALSACGAVKANRNSNALLMLNAGDTKDRVAELMGSPDRREVYGNDEYWIYQTGVANAEVGTYTPILISNGRVVGWGRNYFENVQRTKLEADIKVR